MQVSLPCKSKCFLAYNWKGNDVKSIGRIIGRFDTPTHGESDSVRFDVQVDRS